MRILERGNALWRFFGEFFRPSVRLPLAVLAMMCGVTMQSTAQNRDVSALFPAPTQVTADFPDDVERYVAFDVLYQALSAAAPRPQSKAAYEKGFTYQGSCTGIENLQMQQGMQTYRPWVARRNKLVADQAFRRSVLEKYHLKIQRAPVNQPPVDYQQSPGQIGQSPFVPPNNRIVYPKSPGQALQDLCVRLSPLAALSFAGMILLPWWIMRHSGIKLPVEPRGPGAPGDLQPLPDSLRVIELPGVRYTVNTMSGLVFDKETSVSTSVHTTTTPTQVTTIGNTVHTTPGYTSTHVTRVQKDVVWVHTPDRREEAWTFFGGGFQVHSGQVISAVARRAKDGHLDFLLAYNHATRQLEPQTSNLSLAHGVRNAVRGFIAQPVSTLAGSVGCAIAVGYFLTLGIENLININGVDFFIGLWVVGGFCSLTFAFFFTHWLQWHVANWRNKRFIVRYGPQFRQFFEQGTPALQKQFGAR
jgi:hypothetical protein